MMDDIKDVQRQRVIAKMSAYGIVIAIVLVGIEILRRVRPQWMSSENTILICISTTAGVMLVNRLVNFIVEKAYPLPQKLEIVERD